jgi:hypothetical protein
LLFVKSRLVKEMRKFSREIIALLIATLLLTMFAPSITYAAGGLEQEGTVEWHAEDDGYVNAVTAGNADADVDTEIVTAGYSYNRSTHFYSGEVNLWNWNGTGITLEHREIYDPEDTWSTDTRFQAVFLANVDNETDTEIVMAGYGAFLGVQELGLLIVANWNGSTMETKASQYWPVVNNETKFFGAVSADVDKDGVTEIVAVGYRNMTDYSGTGFHAAMTVWNVTGTALEMEYEQEWMIGGGETIARAVSIDDVDGDGDLEILITGDYQDTNLDLRCAMLRICEWDNDDEEFVWRASTQWYTYSDTDSYDIATGDINSDGITEIVTVGTQTGGEATNAQIRVWTWKDEVLTLKLSIEEGVVMFLTGTRGKAVAIGDVDNDGVNELVVSTDVSFLFSATPNIKIMAWKGETLTTKDNVDWTQATQGQDIAISDVDGDGVTEILAAGYYAPFWIGLPPKPYDKSELGIWDISKVASTITVNVDSANIIIGGHVTISGQISNETGSTPISQVEVTLESAYGTLPVFMTIGKVMTDENGEYTFTYTPSVASNYTIKASWNGDYEHEKAENTTSLTVNKASSVITLVLSQYTAEIGDTIIVNGIIYPAVSTTVTMQYTMPNGTVITSATVSNSAGAFSGTFTADQAGEWLVTASWEGNAQYASAASLPITVTAQVVDQTTSTLAMAGLGIGLVALIVAALGIYMASKKKTAPPPPATPAPT